MKRQRSGRVINVASFNGLVGFAGKFYPLVPLRRLLSVREVAEYALFLASDRAAGITGAAAVIDGGYTAQ